jgi:hypothetical protein
MIKYYVQMSNEVIIFLFIILFYINLLSTIGIYNFYKNELKHLHDYIFEEYMGLRNISQNILLTVLSNIYASIH